MTGRISCNTATDIALAYREIERAKELLAKVETTLAERKPLDLRDAFGRPAGALHLGVPSGPSSHTLYQVPFELCRPIIHAHIAMHEQKIAALCLAARAELDGGPQEHAE